MPLCPHGELPKLCAKCPDLAPVASAASASPSLSSSSSSGSVAPQGGAALTVSLPSGATVTFRPIVAGPYSHEGVLQYPNIMSIPNSDYSDIRPFQQSLTVSGFSDKAPIFTANVASKVSELTANTALVPWVPVIYKEGSLWLNGDKHHTLVAALMCRRQVTLKMAKLSQYTPATVNWNNIVWVEGKARANTEITKDQIAKKGFYSKLF